MCCKTEVRSTRVMAGETISDVVNRLLNKPKGHPTKQHWNDIYRHDQTSGRFVRVADPGRIYFGETLSYLPNYSGQAGAAGSKSRHDPRKRVSDGVTNPEPRAANADELKVIQADAKLAEVYVQKAYRALLNLSKNPAVWHTFRDAFIGDAMVIGGSGKPSQPTPEQIRLAGKAASFYGKMLTSLRNGSITYMVQDSEVKTGQGWAYAYAQYGNHIAFSKRRYFVGRTADQRAKTFIHELAHYSWDAGHAYAGATEELHGTGQSINFISVEWPAALQGADRYAEFALRIGKAK